MDIWYEVSFPVVESNFGVDFSRVEEFIKKKEIEGSCFFIIKRPYIFLRTTKNIDYEKIYEPELFQFGGLEGWNVIVNALKKLCQIRITENKFICTHYEYVAASILTSIFLDCEENIKRKTLSLFNYNRTFSRNFKNIIDINEEERETNLELFFLQEMTKNLLQIKNLQFSLDKILNSAIIFLYNVCDIPLKAQENVLSKFQKEYSYERKR